MNEEDSKPHIEIGREIDPQLYQHRSFNARYIRQNRKSKQSLFKLTYVFTLYQFLKQKTVSRLFWGRSNFYKNISHLIIVATTILITITGVMIRISTLTSSEKASFEVGNSITGTNDLLQQGGSIDTVLLSSSDTVLTVSWTEHIVKEGETLEAIEAQYQVTKATIQSANAKKYPALFLGSNVNPGWVLQIPDINGVIHEVRAGEDIDKIVEKYAATGNREANRFNIIEFNALVEPYTLKVGQLLFIPDGNTSLISSDITLDVSELEGALIDPLSHPSCSGYSFSRGFLPYHNGVDLAKWDGCQIVSVADGVVEYAGSASQGQGHMVRINHGGGIKTEYFHGNGEYYVKTGDVVDQNQPLMYMGTSGNSTGTHLHFILWKDGIAINPRPYVPYIGSY